jgi:DNA-binding beta-propeller fold protein YncE
MNNLQKCVWILLPACLLLVSVSLFSPTVHADGGAPNLAYVAGTAKGISAIDIAQQTVTTTFTVLGNPQAVYLSLDGRFLYVAQPALNQVSMLAAKTGQVICSAHIPGHPSFLSYDTASSTLFAAGNQAASVSDIDMSTCKVLHTITTGAPVTGMAIAGTGSNGSGNQLWVSNGSGISIYDTKTYKETGNIPISAGPRFIDAPSGFWMYVTTQQGGLDAVQLNSHLVLPLLSGGQFGTMDFDEITGEVYVPDMAHQQLDVITPPDPSATTAPTEPGFVYHFKAAPQSVAITGDGQFGFVALINGSVAMLDVPGKQLVKTISVGGDPSFIITGLYPPAIGTTPQSASTLVTIATIAAYILVALAICVPIWFLLRQSRKRKGVPMKK